MDLSGLEKLKEVLAKAKDFGSVFNYFMDHFGEDLEFHDIGEKTRNPLLESTMGEIAKQMFGDRATIRDLLLISVPGTAFVHGGCLVAGRVANVLYFDDVQIGLLTVVPGRRGEDTKFSRFSCRRLPPEAVGSEN